MAVVKRKISLNDVKFDEQLSPDAGWVNLRLKWIVNEEVGATLGTFGYVEFLSGSSHELHRHPNADEVFYVLSGRGIVRSGDEVFEIAEGDTVFVPRGDPHSFQNSDESKPLVALFAYLGKPSLQKAGYEVEKS
jgi:quercetin dioxygenase-like cupin family protein